MPPLALWQSNPTAITEFAVEQVVATEGDGRLRDDSEFSREFSVYLAQVGTERLAWYAERCLEKPFTDSGLVLQDIVNELGRGPE